MAKGSKNSQSDNKWQTMVAARSFSPGIATPASFSELVLTTTGRPVALSEENPDAHERLLRQQRAREHLKHSHHHREEHAHHEGESWHERALEEGCDTKLGR